MNDFGETSGVTVTVLVDNQADLMVKSTETVIRFTDEPLLSEHGFAALIDLPAGDRILWDAGMTDLALPENMRCLKIDPTTIDKIALSHGHDDHTGAMTTVLKSIGARFAPRKWDKGTTVEEIEGWLNEQWIPLIAHPAAFRERWNLRDDGSMRGPVLPPPRGEWEAAGAQVILVEGPYQLAPGCWTTGTVPRTSFEKAGTSPNELYRQGERFLRDDIDDDQAIVINVQDKGLVVVAGCAHSGIVNTIQHAQKISGVGRVWAVLGGFHLVPADCEEIQRTIDALKALAPKMVVPIHCTGFKAINEFARQMPEAFVQGTVGTKYLI